MSSDYRCPDCGAASFTVACGRPCPHCTDSPSVVAALVEAEGPVKAHNITLIMACPVLVPDLIVGAVLFLGGLIGLLLDSRPRP